MPIVTDAWSEVDPLGTDGFNTVDDAMQRLERRIRERANQGSHDWNNATLARAGRHSLGHGSGSVGDGVDGEFSIYDEDVTTKLFRLCNNNAALAAADRQAIHYNWAVLKKILLDNFVDGANVAFALDTGVAVANAAAKVLQILVNNVEKLALDKDLLFLTPNVGSAGLAPNAVHPAVSTVLAAAASSAVATSETVRITTSYTPAAGNVGALFVLNLTYDQTSSTALTNCEVRLYVGGVLKAKGIWHVGTTTGVSHTSVSFAWFEPAMAVAPTTIEVRDIRTNTNTVYNYRGDLVQGYLTISEFKR